MRSLTARGESEDNLARSASDHAGFVIAIDAPATAIACQMPTLPLALHSASDVAMPDRVDAGPECRNLLVGPVSKAMWFALRRLDGYVRGREPC